MMVSTAGQAYTFHFRHPRARRVYLAGDFSGRGTDVLPMERLETDAWVARLHLPPGTYRFRYYVDEDGVLTFYAPEGAGRDTGGWDAVLRVGPADRVGATAEAAEPGGTRVRREIGRGTDGRRDAPSLASAPSLTSAGLAIAPRSPSPFRDVKREEVRV